MDARLVPGSLGAVARQTGQGLAQSFMQADAVILVDTSASMDARDVPGEVPTSRYAAACAQLKALQAQIPGRVAVISFSSTVEFCPGGVPRNLGASTNMAAALDYVLPCDGTGMRLILISDGEPDDADATLAVARRFTGPIETVFVGSGRGAAFLAKLAKFTGGQSVTRAIPQLAQHLAGLLEGGR